MREKNYFSRSKKLLKNSVGIMGAVFGLCICVGFSMPETASAKKVSSTLKMVCLRLQEKERCLKVPCLRLHRKRK